MDICRINNITQPGALHFTMGESWGRYLGPGVLQINHNTTKVNGYTL